MTDDARAAWSVAIRGWESIDAPAARFNAELLTALAGRWANALKPIGSMLCIWFVRPDDNHPFAQWVAVEHETADRVRVSLYRSFPRRSLKDPGGTVIVAGDFARPENVPLVVESFLWHLADPEARPGPQQPASRGPRPRRPRPDG